MIKNRNARKKDVREREEEIVREKGTKKEVELRVRKKF